MKRERSRVGGGVPGRAGVLLGIAALVAAVGCRPSGREPEPLARGGEVKASAPKIPPPAVRSTREPPKVESVYDDPRLAGVRDLERAKDYANAARQVDEARRAYPAEIASICGWSYVSGRLHVLAGEQPEAVNAFDAVKDECPLAPYARLRAGQALGKTARWEEAFQHAHAVPTTLPAYDEAKIVLADALSARGERPAAAKLWREILAENGHTPRWVELSVRLANAILDGAAGPDANPREALDLSTRVLIEIPKIAESSGAQASQKRAALALRKADPQFREGLSEADQVRQVQGWLDGGEATKALTAANAIIASWPAGKTGSTACKLGTLRAQAIARTKQPAADAWGDAIRMCTGDEQLVNALFQGGKSSRSANRTQEAVERFGKVEQQFPRHRLADDARLLAGLLLGESGDESRFTSMLLGLPDDYPEGDMRTEALFRVALHRMTRGDWSGAKDPLDRAIVLDPLERSWIASGRAPYFRARVSEMKGDTEDAKTRYAKIIDDFPLTFYMTQAYVRLSALDEGMAARTLEAASAREPTGPFITRDHPELATPAFDRAVRLLEVGESEAAKKELTRAGFLGDEADHELLWIIADVYDRGGAPDLGHMFSRSRLTEHLAHYPVGTWRYAWEAAYPRAFDALVKKESEANGIPLSLTWGIMREESTFVTDARSGASAIGLMQLVVPTARGLARGSTLPWDEMSLKRPDVNIAFGTKLLAQLRTSYAQNKMLAVSAYNSGPTAVNRWLAKRTVTDFDLFVENIPYEETRRYIKSVLSSYAAYAFLYDRPALKEVFAVPLRVVP
ncbi:transglycosylase SLT domain-containing protein [Pendulispora albinea]|uniref:Lytic transglycosylase domain-containing protein n=1 Tax=Pendulispora albinea TaxID=2741071 RepID=A0ABZ2LS43_9BACT